MITIRELARIAGVSPATVSKALNNQNDISEAMKEQIYQLAKEYGYEKKRPAPTEGQPFSGLRVGIIFDDLYSNYYSRLVDAFCEKIYQMNGVPILMDKLFSAQRGMELGWYLKKTRIVDGIIYISTCFEEMHLEDLEFPVVACLDSMHISMRYNLVDTIFADARPGLNEAIRQLMDQGHRSFAYLGEFRAMRSRDEFMDLMDQFDIPMEHRYVDMVEERYDLAGFHMMEKLFAQPTLPSAIICAYDNLARGAALSITGRGFQVPDTFSLVGIDDSQLIIPGGRKISSVDRKISEQVDIMMALLIKRMKEPQNAVQNVNLLSDFIARDTIGKRAAWVNRPDE